MIPNYTQATGNKRCANCLSYKAGGFCSRYKEMVNPKYTCKSWNGSEQKEVSATPTAVYAHGPGGLFSHPGLGEREKAVPMKKEQDGLHPSTHYLIVVDKAKPSTWHLRVRDVDGRLDNRLMGAAQARGNKYQGPQKRLALVKLRRLQKQAKTTTYKPGLQHGASIKNPKVYDALRKRGYSKEASARISNAMVSRKKTSSLAVTKDANGQWRWVALSSNAYRDRDGEIVSRKALADDVERADRTGDYGVLRFWHMPGLDIGDADFNMLSPSGKTLIESGTFRDPRIAMKVAKKAKNYQVSIGFRHPPDEPKKGVFYNIKRFERSLVPAGKAANPFTSLTVKENNDMSDPTFKVREFKSLLEDDDLANQLLDQATVSEKQADDMGYAFKEYEDDSLLDMSADELLDFALAMKEAEEEVLKAKKKKPARQASLFEDEDEFDDEEMEAMPKRGKAEMTEYETKMADGMTAMTKKMDAMYKMLQNMGQTNKAANEDWTEVADIHTLRIADLEDKVTQLHGALETATKELASLKGETPEAILQGVRPTQSDENITGETPQVGVAHKNGQATAADGFFDFVTGGTD